MNNMFEGCTSLIDLDISNFDTKNVEDMTSLFSYTSIPQLNLIWNTANVKSMKYMFYHMPELTELKFGTYFSTENVENMQGMFLECMNLKSLDVSRFKVEKVQNFETFIKT